jgi:transcriptional regulator with XRE-family HTH domain
VILYGLDSAMQGRKLAEVAKAAGLDIASVSRLRRCQHGAFPATVADLAAALGVSEEALRGQPPA